MSEITFKDNEDFQSFLAEVRKDFGQRKERDYCADYKKIRPWICRVLPFLPDNLQTIIRILMRLADKACDIDAQPC